MTLLAKGPLSSLAEHRQFSFFPKLLGTGLIACLFHLFFSKFLVSQQKNVIFLHPARPDISLDRKSTRLNSSHSGESRMPSSA